MGDGGIGKYSSGKDIYGNRRYVWECNFAGTKNILEYIKDSFSDLNCKSHVIKRKHSKSYQLRFSKKRCVFEVMKRIMDNAPFYIERKYNAYLEMYKELENDKGYR